MKPQEVWSDVRERGISNMKGLLKFITCGSVDDGKSTLIGHILYDAKLLYTDQEQALELDSKLGSREGAVDYSLLLDGLMAEREQGITIDVAYRYFTTDNRSFIVADTPGHEEYTRNMAVGASFADLAIILVDAKQGVLVQTKRHARICSLMGIRHFVFAVNKMDLIGYDQVTFEKITEQIQELVNELALDDIKIIPVSATEGDNITTHSDNIPWYDDEDLLTYLEQIDVKRTEQEAGFYMPVQRVCRPNHTFRGFQGQIEAGQVSVGSQIKTLPSNEHARVKSIHVGDKEVVEASVGQPVTIQLDTEVDVSKGCVLEIDAQLVATDHFSATILWMDDTQLTPGKNFMVKIGTKMIPGIVQEIVYRVDVNTGEQLDANTLMKNEIGLCEILLSEKVVSDEFARHKTLGELILIDRITNMTSACGIIEHTDVNLAKDNSSQLKITKDMRARQKGQKPVTLCFVEGEQSDSIRIVKDVERNLFVGGKHAMRLTVSSGKELGDQAKLLSEAGIIVLISGTGLTLEDRAYLEKEIGTNNYIEVHLAEYYDFDNEINVEQIMNDVYRDIRLDIADEIEYQI